MTPIPDPADLRALVARLEHGLLERDAAVRLALLAALAGEHVLLIGPPGSAKSELARRVHRAFADTRYFERLLTRFSTPEELFGPLSLAALEDDRYERLVDGYLPTAGVAFLDEVFKANSAILNALLALLNERVFDNGRDRVRVPLVSVIGASNEGPTDEALRAFHDRFLVRIAVEPVSDASFEALLALDSAAAAPAATPLTAAQCEALRAAAGRVALGDEARQALVALRRWLAAEGLTAPSDRRWRQWVALMGVAAASEGRASLDALDLWTAPYVVAPEPAQAATVEAWFVGRLLEAAPLDAAWLTRAVEAFELQLEVERQAPPENGADSDAGKLAALRAAGGAQGDALAATRLVSEALQASAGRRYGALHIATRVAQVRTLRERTDAACAALEAQLAGLAQRLAPRWWWPPSLVERVLAGPRSTGQRLAGLRSRLLACEQGFGSLPCDGTADAPAPAPVPLPA
ncbi:MAG TPA: AAA family ATPase [Burkholderiaceae bacterium]|nr:AAA family ATPase [Burkholderiaceae bacterium]